MTYSVLTLPVVTLTGGNKLVARTFMGKTTEKKKQNEIFYEIFYEIRRESQAHV